MAAQDTEGESRVDVDPIVDTLISKALDHLDEQTVRDAVAREGTQVYDLDHLNDPDLAKLSDEERGHRHARESRRRLP